MNERRYFTLNLCGLFCKYHRSLYYIYIFFFFCLRRESMECIVTLFAMHLPWFLDIILWFMKSNTRRLSRSLRRSSYNFSLSYINQKPLIQCLQRYSCLIIVIHLQNLFLLVQSLWTNWKLYLWTYKKNEYGSALCFCPFD